MITMYIYRGSSPSAVQDTPDMVAGQPPPFLRIIDRELLHAHPHNHVRQCSFRFEQIGLSRTDHTVGDLRVGFCSPILEFLPTVIAVISDRGTDRAAVPALPGLRLLTFFFNADGKTGTTRGNNHDFTFDRAAMCRGHTGIKLRHENTFPIRPAFSQTLRQSREFPASGAAMIRSMLLQTGHASGSGEFDPR